MHFFPLLGFQHVVLYIFPTLIFVVLLGMFLGYAHFRSQDSEARRGNIHTRFAEDIENRREPFPIAMALIIVGTIVWMLGYILAIGLLEVRI